MLSLLLFLNLALGQTVPKDVLCPKVGENFLLSAKNTQRAMINLYSTQKEHQGKLEEYYFLALELDRNDKDTLSKLKLISKNLKDQNNRSESNYNESVKKLASLIGKVKSCWGFHQAKDKKEIADLLQIYQSRQVLPKFKKCNLSLKETNKKRLEYVINAIDYQENKINKTQFSSRNKKHESDIKFEVTRSKKNCQDFESGSFKEFIK